MLSTLEPVMKYFCVKIFLSFSLLYTEKEEASPWEWCDLDSRCRWSSFCWRGPRWSLPRCTHSETCRLGRGALPSEAADWSSSAGVWREAGGPWSPPGTQRPRWEHGCWETQTHVSYGLFFHVIDIHKVSKRPQQLTQTYFILGNLLKCTFKCNGQRA